MATLPPPEWPKHPSRVLKDKIQGIPSVINTKKLAAGLAWPDEGYPGCICIVSEKPVDISSTFDLIHPTIEILVEYEAPVLSELLPRLLLMGKLGCREMYADLDKKNLAFIREFNQYRRMYNTSVVLRQTRMSSFESAVLKIKEYVAAKRLIMKPTSVLRAQLTRFSKLDFKHEAEFYAVRALGMAIHAFKPTELRSIPAQEVDISAWY